ncbi:MAG: DUF192 domain-containing protein [Candidatus Binatia bacterium]
MPVINLTKNTWLATKVKRADSFRTRLLGLLKRRRLGPEEALWLVPSKGIHTFGMKFPIDVIFLNKDNKVLDVIPSMGPYRATRFHFASYSVLELPEGTIHKSHTAISDELDVSLVESSEIDDLKETRLNEVG